MATPPTPRRPSPLGALANAVRLMFWVLAAGLIACYGFFVALGAFSPGDVLGVTIAVALLAILWMVHAWAQRRHAAERDPRLRAARERRGF
jgi:fatty acid desaturase